MSFLLQNTGQIIIRSKNRKSSVSWKWAFLTPSCRGPVPSVAVLIHRECYIYDNLIHMGYLFAMSEYCIFFYALPSVRVLLLLLRSYACSPAKEPLHRLTQTNNNGFRFWENEAENGKGMGRINQSRCGTQTGMVWTSSKPVHIGIVGLGEGSCWWD